MQASQGKTLSREEFVAARDLLLFKFTISTRTRPAPLNALMKDYETAQESKGNRIILVPKHKRTKDGPAMLGMDPELQQQMAIYVDKIRPKFAVPGEDKLFVKDDGQGFSEGTP